MKYLTYIKNFLINLFSAMAFWIVLFYWWGGFRALFMMPFTIPQLWWVNFKNQIKRR